MVHAARCLAVVSCAAWLGACGLAGCSDASPAALDPAPEPDGSAGVDAGYDAQGEAAVEAASDGEQDGAANETAAPEPPRIASPGAQSIGEDQTLSLQVGLESLPTPDLRIAVSGLPPGASWSEPERRIVFTPDFIQGGRSWDVTLTARNGAGTDTETFTLTVNDTIHPPWPTVVKTEQGSGYKSLWLSQKTDDYLDSPGHAGRTFSARVIVPDGASASKPMPVRAYLHGFGGGPYDGVSSGGQFRIYPHDSMNSYWWGYASSLPGGAPAGQVPNYTQRRVLHLLEWVLREQQGADPERVYVTGGSMGGAGAATLALLYARHFAYADATIGQMIPRNHRPARVGQLAGLWGSPAANLPDGTMLEDGRAAGVWDRQDLCRVLREWPESRRVHLFTKHGKDDPTIHFGAMTLASPVTKRSFLEALRDHGVGHYVVWDEGGHGSADPVMPAGWWDGDWSRSFDPKAWLRRNVAFPAFTNASHDWDPGDGAGNGKQPWSDDSGYAGTVSVAGDTGWNGQLAGARNRFLRWDSNAVVDEPGEFRIPLYVLDGIGSPAPKVGYPGLGDKFDRTLPVKVDVTIRRAQAFACKPGETIAWSFGAAKGTTAAGEDGAVTIAGLPLGLEPVTLVLTR